MKLRHRRKRLPDAAGSYEYPVSAGTPIVPNRVHLLVSESSMF